MPNIPPTTVPINEVIRKAGILVEARDAIKSDPETDITMQLAQAVMFLSELQAGEDS